ncbi:MAG: dTDP-4-dehydrorhamnose 3,5-epimerase family protein [Thermoanaerobaculia bacterium]
MKLTELSLRGAYVVSIEPVEDERGYFAQTFNREEFAWQSLERHVELAAVAFNRKKGTLRGLHFQLAPYQEAKLVRCTRGAIYDVIVDLRPDSPTYTRHYSLVLRAENREQLFVPEGFAHGYQTLADDTEVSYLISAPYVAKASRGYRYDDPSFRINWPERVAMISERDLALPYFHHHPRP